MKSVSKNKDVDRDLQRSRKPAYKYRPIMDDELERSIIDLGQYRTLIEPEKIKTEVIVKRKLVR